jgi:hypothetical protein
MLSDGYRLRERPLGERMTGMMIHLTMTGPHAGLAGCLLVRFGIPESGWGNPYPLPDGDRGVHYAYATGDMIDGTYVAEDGATMCQECVTAFKEAK